jgi:cytochrome c-type biogenesis protein CcmE
MSPGVKLAVGLLVVGTAIGYLGYLGAASSWQYYLTVDEAAADATGLEGQRIRVSGHVTAGSLAVAIDRGQAKFDLAGERRRLHVTCLGPLPDNLAEDIDVVVEGSFQGGEFHADKVVTRCASKYQPKDAAFAEGRLNGPAAPRAASVKFRAPR